MKCSTYACVMLSNGNGNIADTISSPEPSLPLSSGTGKRSTLGKSVLNNRILVIPVKLRRREVLMQDGV